MIFPGTPSLPTSSRSRRAPASAVSRILVLLAGGLLLLGLGGCADDAERVAEFMERGERYVDEGDYEEAIIEFKNVLQREPEHAGAHEALSLAYLEVDKPREAYWEMSETVRLDPDNVDARLRYGTISAAIGETDRALEQAEAVLRIDPSSAAAFSLRAQAREVNEDFAGAEQDLRDAVDADPEAPAFRYLLASFLERRGRSDEAEQALRDLIDVEESYLAVSTLARIVVRDGERSAEAQRLLERATELAKQAPLEAPKRAPGDRKGNTSLRANVLREEAVNNAYLVLSAFHYAAGRRDEAMAVLEEGIEQSPSKIELVYQMARYYRLEGNVEAENELIRRATTEAPDNIAAQLVLSAYLGQQGDLAGALEAARAAVAIDGTHRAAKLREAELLVDLGFRDGNTEQLQAGREIVDAVLESAPDSPEAHFVRAKIELTEGDVAAAKKSLERVLQSRPDWAQARFVLGSALASTGELARARVELARAVELDPQSLESRKMLTRVHAQLGEHEFAIEQGRAYLSQRPDDNDIRIIVGQSLIRVGRAQEAYAEIDAIPEERRDAAAYFALGRLDLAFGREAIEAKRVDEGRARMKRGAERLEKADALSPGNAQVLRTLLQYDRDNGRLDASAARIAKAVELHPQDSEVAEVQAELAQVRGDAAMARKALERAVELDARNVSAQLALADLERRAGNLDAMVAIVERAAQAAPESADLQYRLAMIYEQRDRRPDAIAAYDKAIALKPDFTEAKNNLAYLLAESGGDLDRALELAQSAKAQKPDDGNAADTLGWVLLKRGLPSAAIGYLEEAITHFPENAYEVRGIVGNHLAEAYEANAEPDKALAESRRVLERYERLASLARERQIELDEPEWARAARARVARLEAAS
ncbi:MAG: tetratricopeptide repeat protein [Myxococcales bacterium]|nr:tetratricopeptide repeat protein [Myxococcales bacterium]